MNVYIARSPAWLGCLFAFFLKVLALLRVGIRLSWLYIQTCEFHLIVAFIYCFRSHLHFPLSLSLSRERALNRQHLLPCCWHLCTIYVWFRSIAFYWSGFSMGLIFFLLLLLLLLIFLFLLLLLCLSINTLPSNWPHHFFRFYCISNVDSFKINLLAWWNDALWSFGVHWRFKTHTHNYMYIVHLYSLFCFQYPFAFPGTAVKVECKNYRKWKH